MPGVGDLVELSHDIEQLSRGELLVLADELGLVVGDDPTAQQIKARIRAAEMAR